MYFTSPVSNITPSQASVAMSRSDSRDSTSSNISFPYTCSAYNSLAMSTSPTWAGITSHPLTRTDSNTSSAPSTSTSMRRGSSSNWIPSPYRSCLHATAEEVSSYLSDDELLFLDIPDSSLPIECIPNPEPKKELSTEEQIALLREMRDREESQHQQQRKKSVRFEAADSNSRKSSRRPSNNMRRRTTAVRRGLSQLNGPQ